MKFDVGTLIYRILGDDSGIKKSLKGVNQDAKKSAISFKSIIAGISVAAIGSKLIGFFKDSVDAASNLQEETQKFGVVFSDTFQEASLAARDLADGFGLSKRAAKEFLSTNANLFTSLGASQQEALGLSDQVSRLGIDLASFTNFAGGSTGAVDAITKALIGEREALKGLGISVTEDDLKQFAAQSGKVYQALTKQEKATLTLELITKRSANAVGDFARSADSWANVQRRVDAAVEDTSARIGNELLPGLSKLGVAFLESNKQGSLFTEALKGIAIGVNFVLEGIADYINQGTKFTEKLRENYDEQFKLEKQIQGTKDQIKEYGVELAKAAGQEGTVAQGAAAFQEALKRGDIDARKLSDSVKNLSDDLNVLSIQSVAISDPMKSVNLALAQSFKFARSQAAKRREQLAKNEKAERLYFQRKQARAQAEIDIARFRDNEELAIRLENAKVIDEVENNKLIKASQKAELRKALEKKVEDDIVNYRIQKANEISNMVLGSANNLFSALSALSQAQTQSRINDIDLQMQRALDAAGVEEDTAIEKAEAELQAAIEKGDAELIKEKQDAVKREKILAEYDKKRRKAEYEGAVTVWEFQLAQAGIAALLSVANALSAGWKFGPIGAASYATAAGIAGALQVAAVAESKPKPPKFEGGGIIPGSSSGTTIIAGENNKSEAIFNQSQMKRLLDIADGNAGGLSRVAPMSKDLMYQDLFQASQDGRLFIADKGVVPV